MADESGFDEQRKQLRWASKPLAFFENILLLKYNKVAKASLY